MDSSGEMSVCECSDPLCACEGRVRKNAAFDICPEGAGVPSPDARDRCGASGIMVQGSRGGLTARLCRVLQDSVTEISSREDHWFSILHSTSLRQRGPGFVVYFVTETNKAESHELPQLAHVGNVVHCCRIWHSTSVKIAELIDVAIEVDSRSSSWRYLVPIQSQVLIIQYMPLQVEIGSAFPYITSSSGTFDQICPRIPACGGRCTTD